MKHLTLIVHTDRKQALADRLRTLDPVAGFTFCAAEGHGEETETDPYFTARDGLVGYVPRLRADVLLEDGDLDAVLGALRETDFGPHGQIVYWVSPVEGSGRL